jgi:hypothetical protein
MSTKADKAYQMEAIERLRELLPPGTVVTMILRHVARSGMTRWISPVIFDQQGGTDLSPWVGRAVGWPANRAHEGVKVTGCGMDMGFHLVYTLSHILYPDGFDCLGDRCPSNDHSNRVERSHHDQGGYALIMRWI